MFYLLMMFVVHTAAGETELSSAAALLLGSLSVSTNTQAGQKKLVLQKTLETFQCSSVLPPSGQQGKEHTPTAFSVTGMNINHQIFHFIFTYLIIYDMYTPDICLSFVYFWHNSGI